MPLSDPKMIKRDLKGVVKNLWDPQEQQGLHVACRSLPEYTLQSSCPQEWPLCGKGDRLWEIWCFERNEARCCSDCLLGAGRLPSKVKESHWSLI